jgi:hypothetical protein
MKHQDDSSDSLQAPWVVQTREELEASARDLDAATLSRLNRARQAALLAARSPAQTRWRWMSALALAGVAGLALGMAWWRGASDQVGTPASATIDAQDFDLLAGQDSLDLYEDLEFYAWLDAQQSQG